MERCFTSHSSTPAIPIPFIPSGSAVHIALSALRRRRFRQHLQRTIKQALALASYLDWVPEESMQGSCIYHTDKGCALPRPLRSDICNAYFCDAVREYQGRFIHAPKEQLFIIRRDHDNWNRFDKPEGNTVVDTQLLAGGVIDVLEC